jgi:NADH-quinone oxidoreductase subunit H
MFFSSLLGEYQLPVFITFILKIIFILIAVAYFTIAERKIMAAIQRRRGPNVAGGLFGILQPLADGFKLFIKEIVLPGRINIFLYFFAPILVFALSLIGWFLIPFNAEIFKFLITTTAIVDEVTSPVRGTFISAFL